MARPRRDQSFIKRIKKPEQEALCCAVCGWMPPKALAALGRDARTMVHLHHVVPLSCGGHDVLCNVVLLCPTHHALAHRLGRMRKRYGRMRWDGPSDPDQVVRELRMMEQEPERFIAYVEAGRSYHRLMDEEWEAIKRAEYA